MAGSFPSVAGKPIRGTCPGMTGVRPCRIIAIYNVDAKRKRRESDDKRWEW